MNIEAFLEYLKHCPEEDFQHILRVVLKETFRREDFQALTKIARALKLQYAV